MRLIYLGFFRLCYYSGSSVIYLAADRDGSRAQGTSDIHMLDRTK